MVMPRQKRGVWLRQLHRWHWISAAVSLVGMLLFAVTGITLNHAASIEASPQRVHLTDVLPAQLLAEIDDSKQIATDADMPLPVQSWLSKNLDVVVSGQRIEWSADEAYVSLPRPGGDAWLSIDRLTGEVEYELTDRGWISYFNDLHKGRNTGAAWSWFIDVFALACVVFSLSGLFLMMMHARNRRSTWPLVGLGALIPLLLMLLFIH